MLFGVRLKVKYAAALNIWGYNTDLKGRRGAAKWSRCATNSNVN